MQLFFNPEITPDTSEIFFEREESKHIAKVLRKTSGDTITITNGKGYLFTCKLTLATPNKCKAIIIQQEFKQKRKYSIHIAVAPTKMNERFEWFLEKATEIGIDEITPILCEHSERKIIKEQRYEKVLISAMKQSLQLYKPVLNPLISFKDFITNNNYKQRYIAHCEKTNKSNLKGNIINNEDILVLIGPEGDFSLKEIKSAIEENQFTPVALGNTRLRTETAAMVACHSIIYSNE